MRRGSVMRRALVDELTCSEAPVTVVTGPPGYGKTTLLAQWAAAGERVAWLSADEVDNDPRVLLVYLAAAVDRIEPIGSEIFAAVARRPLPTAVGRLIAGLAEMSEPVAIAIDHVDRITNPVSQDIVREIAMGVPVRCRLVLASRGAFPTAQLRAHGRLAEIKVSELALDRVEATALLDAADVHVSDEVVAELVAHTEGWAAGIYLAALSIREGTLPTDELDRLAGAHRYIDDYLRTELLDHVEQDEVAFLRRTSILDRLNGSLCDSILEEIGSAARLEKIEARNLLLVPLDLHREWYRYHQMLREFLADELQRGSPASSRSSMREHRRGSKRAVTSSERCTTRSSRTTASDRPDSSTTSPS
jgi:LuxR family maltose regulon positive regulatory protein